MGGKIDRRGLLILGAVALAAAAGGCAVMRPRRYRTPVCPGMPIEDTFG